MGCIYGYARCSHLDSANSGLGLEVQRQQIKQAADRMIAKDSDLLWRGVYEDKVVSAYKTDLICRPAGKKLYEVLQAGDTIIFAKMDRGFRSLRDFAVTCSLFKSMGVTLMFLDTGVDGSTPQGELMLGMLALMAQFDSALKSERNKEVYALRKAKGQVRWHGTMVHRNINGQRHLLDHKKIAFFRWVYWLKERHRMTRLEIFEHVEQTLARRENRPVAPLFKRKWPERKVREILDKWPSFKLRLAAIPRPKKRMLDNYTRSPRPTIIGWTFS